MKDGEFPDRSNRYSNFVDGQSNAADTSSELETIDGDNFEKLGIIGRS